MNTAVSVRLPKFLPNSWIASPRKQKGLDPTLSKSLESYIEDYADLQVALDRLHDKTDPVISGKDLRKSLGL